ncbi:MAG: hypothetical protein AAGJ97_01155, partial [Planctomycetota bacterium]
MGGPIAAIGILLFAAACVATAADASATTDATLRDVAVSASGVAWACGDRGCLLRSDDSGRAWRPVETSVLIQWRGVASVGGRTVCVGTELPAARLRTG